MVNYFLHNRHGSISIMLSVMLIAVLSLSSSLMETARYKSTQRLFDELEQNAAFSLLGNYDRDLYEQFGLLALSDDVGSAELKQYLQWNLSGLNSTMSLNGVDAILDIGEVQVDKIYDLTQMEVLRSQIMEFTAYRAPVELADNILDIEDTLTDLSKKLSEVLPMFQAMKDLASAIESMLDTFIKIDELNEQAETLQTEVDSYKEKVNDLNDAIDERANFVEEHDESEEGYATELENKTMAITTCATELQTQIDSTYEAVSLYYEKYKEYHESYDKMLEKSVATAFDVAKSNVSKISDEKTKKNSKKLLEDMETNYNASVDLCETLIDVLNQSYDLEVESNKTKLTEQKSELNTALSSPENMEKVEMIEGLDDKHTLMNVVTTVLQTAKRLQIVVKEWNEAIAKIGDAIKAMKVVVTGGIYDPEFNNVISGDIWNSLPSVSNGGTLKSASNPYGDEDATTVSEQLARTQTIANSISFDISSMDPQSAFTEASALELAMTRMYNATVEFQNTCEKISSGNIFTILFTLKDIVSSLIEFLASIINLITAFATNMTIENITKMIYQKMWIAVYANTMFSNRTTDDESKLNGEDFENLQTLLYGNNACFDQANVEYIFSGTSSEITNQTKTFMILLAWRLIANIPTVMSDSNLMQILTDLCGIPFVGWIVAIVVFGIVLFVEAWADVVFLVYTSDGVELIKTEGYFALDGGGLDNFVEKVEDMFETLKEDDEDDEDKNFLTEYTEGLLKLKYSDYTLLTMMLFVPNEQILSRTADLIQMQMNCIKKNGGDIDGFKLEDMATYIRVNVNASYTPLLPIPTIPGINDNGIAMNVMHYSGY